MKDRNLIKLIGSCDQLRSTLDNMIMKFNTVEKAGDESELQKLIKSLNCSWDHEEMPRMIRSLPDHFCYLVGIAAVLALHESIIRKSEEIGM